MQALCNHMNLVRIPRRDRMYLVYCMYDSRRDHAPYIVHISTSYVHTLTQSRRGIMSWMITTHHTYGTTRYHVMISTSHVSITCTTHMISMMITHEIVQIIKHLPTGIMHDIMYITCTRSHVSKQETTTDNTGLRVLWWSRCRKYWLERSIATRGRWVRPL